MKKSFEIISVLLLSLLMSNAAQAGVIGPTIEKPDEDLQAKLCCSSLCPDCSRLLEHGIAKLSLCEYDPKPPCRKCQTHCYAPGYREKVRQVMRFSGTYLLKHGRLDLLLHYLT